MVAPMLPALVVDDDPVVRNLTVRALTQLGFACDAAADGQDARQLLNLQEYEVVVTDLRMPNHHGHALCVELLLSEPRPLVVVLTGVVDPRLQQDLRRRGVDLIRLKPVDYPTFAHEIRSMVSARRSAPSTGAPAENRPKATVEPLSPPRIEQTLPTPPSETPAPVEISQSAAPVSAKQVVGILTCSAERTAEIAEAMNSDRVEPLPTTGSEELHRLVNRQRIDALVVEQSLDGFLTGLEVYSRLFEQLVRPKSLLLAEESDEIHQQAERLGIDLVMPLSATATDIQLAVHGLISHESDHNAFIPRQARQIVQKYGDIPPLPQLLVRLTAYMEMPLTQIPLKELARDISVDPKATTELLKLTNSSSSGLSREITNVLDAVKLHGAKKTIALILGSATFGIQSQLSEQWDDPVRRWYQRRSVLVASTAATFATRLEEVSADTAFVLGLLQDIGCLVLARKFSSRYLQVLDRLRRVGQSQLHAMELEDFNMSHAEVSAALMQKWGLPQSLIRPVINHHSPEAATSQSNAERSFSRVMQIAEAFANLVDIAHPFRRNQFNRLIGGYGAAKASACKSAMSEAVARTAELCQLFSLPVPEPEELQQILSITQVWEDAASDDTIELPNTR